jgi:hypothetical protein
MQRQIVKQDKSGKLSIAKNGESELQQGCVTWFRLQHARYRKLLWACPNGGKREEAEAQRLVREGVVAGVADLFLSIARKGFHGMYIEMKYGKGTMSQEQEDFKLAVEKQGFKHVCCWSFNEFEREINFYLN